MDASKSKTKLMKVKEENIVFLTISSFVGASPGAIHYYGRLEHLQGDEAVDVTYKLTQKEADRFNVKWKVGGCEDLFGYQEGEKSERFPSEKKLIVAAKKQFKVHFPKATVLVLGSSSVCEPQEILVGPKEFKDKITNLAKQYDKLDWDDVVDRPMIEKIEEEWQKLWPRKYM